MAQDRPAALVTGSASGIGRAAALRLAQAGYDVAINYSRSRDAAGQTLAELEKLGGQHLAVRADVSDDAAGAPGQDRDARGSGLPSLRHRPYQVVRRGCPSHAVTAT